MEDYLPWLGYMAAFCTTLSFLPQVLQTLKTRDTSSISLAMYVLFVIGITFWLLYGIMKSDIPMILANTITLFLSSIILMMKIKDSFVEYRINSSEQ